MFPQTNGNEGGAGGPISCQLHWRNWHYSSFLKDDYDDDGEVDDDRDTQCCCCWYDVFGMYQSRMYYYSGLSASKATVKESLLWFCLDTGR